MNEVIRDIFIVGIADVVLMEILRWLGIPYFKDITYGLVIVLWGFIVLHIYHDLTSFL